jgi:hypothetical protein
MAMLRELAVGGLLDADRSRLVVGDGSAGNAAIDGAVVRAPLLSAPDGPQGRQGARPAHRGRAGWIVVQSAKNYYLVYGPEGRYITRIPSTPSGRSFYQRTIRILKKNGFPW